MGQMYHIYRYEVWLYFQQAYCIRTLSCHIGRHYAARGPPFIIFNLERIRSPLQAID